MSDNGKIFFNLIELKEKTQYEDHLNGLAYVVERLYSIPLKFSDANKVKYGSIWKFLTMHRVCLLTAPKPELDKPSYKELYDLECKIRDVINQESVENRPLKFLYIEYNDNWDAWGSETPQFYIFAKTTEHVDANEKLAGNVEETPKPYTSDNPWTKYVKDYATQTVMNSEEDENFRTWRDLWVNKHKKGK